MWPFDPKIAEEVGTKVYAQKYRLRNGCKILRGLETLELAIRSRFIRRRDRFKRRTYPNIELDRLAISDHLLNWSKKNL